MMKKDLPGWLWISFTAVVAMVLGFLDFITGYDLNFFVFYFLPVSLAAWFAGRSASLSLAVLSVMVWFGADVLSGHAQASHFHTIWNTTIRLASFLLIGWSVSEIRHLLDRERQSTEELGRLRSKVKVLEKFLPICCLCKKIRNKENQWQQMEIYIGEHTGTQFSHSYCPECAKKAMAEAGLIDK